MATRKALVSNLRRAIRKVNRRRKSSGFEKEIYAILKEEDISFMKEKTVGRCHADLLIGSKNLIELQGCYFHGHSVCQGDLNKKQKEAQASDARRFYFFRKLGFKVTAIWECEFYKDLEGTRKLLRKIADEEGL